MNEKRKLFEDTSNMDTLISLEPKTKFKSASTPIDNNKQENNKNPHFDNMSVFNFDTPQGSPYSRRYPAGEKQYVNNDYGYKENLQSVNWTPSGSDEDFDMNKIKDLALPIELRRYQSVQSLKHKRDPHYQGNRSRKSKRVIDKSGERNVDYLNIPQRSWIFFKDFFTTLIDEQWRYVITVFALSYVVCWILFAILWYLIAHAHGDLKIDPVTGESLKDDAVPCVENAATFSAFLLFSIETQVSIGYGSKFPNEVCPEGVFLMVLQIVIGIAIEGTMVGIVYAKMVRPPKHTSDMKFSKKAVICQRNSKLCLVFRICDSTQSHTVESRIRAYWFEERQSLEGEHLRQFQNLLKLDNENIFLIHPQTVCHVIDHTSPLYDLSAKDILQRKFEIILTLTGTSTSTAQMKQSRTSYLPKEILWGYRFVNILQYSKKNEAYVADYCKFEEVEQVDAPLCSARRLDEILEEMREMFDNDVPPEYADQPIINYHDTDLQHDISLPLPAAQIGELVIEPIPKQLIIKQIQSSNEEKIENVINETSEIENKFRMKKFVEELEMKLSSPNLNLINGTNDYNSNVKDSKL